MAAMYQMRQLRAKPHQRPLPGELPSVETLRAWAARACLPTAQPQKLTQELSQELAQAPTA